MAMTTDYCRAFFHMYSGYYQKRNLIPTTLVDKLILLVITKIRGSPFTLETTRRAS
jgi:hypothetical protein